MENPEKFFDINNWEFHSFDNKYFAVYSDYKKSDGSVDPVKHYYMIYFLSDERFWSRRFFEGTDLDFTEKAKIKFVSSEEWVFEQSKFINLFYFDMTFEELKYKLDKKLKELHNNNKNMFSKDDLPSLEGCLS